MPGALQHRAHRATGDDTGTGAGRAQQHHTGGGLTLHAVDDRAADARDAEEVLLRLLDTLGDRRRHLLGLAVADADQAVAVADDHQGGEAEAPTTLDDLGHAVDRDQALDVRSLVLRAAAAAPVAAVTTATTGAVAVAPPPGPPGPPAPPPSRRVRPGIRRSLQSCSWSSELQTALAGGVGQRRDPTVVVVATAVEHDGRDAGRLGALGDELADLRARGPSCRRRARARRPRAWTPRPACGRRGRRSAGRRCAARCG